MVTGVVLIPIVVSIVLYAPAQWIIAVAAALCLLALLEFNRLGHSASADRRFDWLGAAAGAALVPVLFYFGFSSLAPFALASVFIFFFYGAVSKRAIRDASLDVAHKALGLVYVALPLSFIAPLHSLDMGSWWLLFLLAVVWANDTCAYFTGRSFGRRKLSPEISPKKTVEGAVGGILGGVAVAVAFNHLAHLGILAWEAAALSAAIGVIAMMGDLAESLLKRGVGVKDSGTLIPGHGGVLDRIDSLLFPLPLLYYFLACQAYY